MPPPAEMVTALAFNAVIPLWKQVCKLLMPSWLLFSQAAWLHLACLCSFFCTNYVAVFVPFFFTHVALLVLFFFIRCVALLVPFFTRCMDVLVVFFTSCVALLVLFYPLRSCACPFLPVAWLCSYLNYYMLRGCARTLSPAYVTWLYLSFFTRCVAFLFFFFSFFTRCVAVLLLFNPLHGCTC